VTVATFMKTLAGIDYSQEPRRLFDDFLWFSSTSLYQVYANDNDLEDEYIRRFKRYGSEKMTEFSKLLAMTIEGLSGDDGIYNDFLGQVIMCEEIGGNARTGQFFTPYPLSVACAGMTMPQTWPAGRVLTIAEPAAGSGGMCLAACQILHDRKIDFQRWVYIEATDVDERCFRATYIQLALIGCPATVIHGNTLSGERWMAWSTPMFYESWMEFKLSARPNEAIEMVMPEPALVRAGQYEMFEVSA
jgi:hypothetical protein